jgi:hypothetical protein
MAYGTIEYARARADEWRDTFLITAVSAMQKLGTPLRVDLFPVLSIIQIVR